MDETEFDIYVDRNTAAFILQLSIKLKEPVPDLLTRIMETGWVEQIQKN